MNLAFEVGIDVVLRHGHTPSRRVGPRGMSAVLKLSLRGIKEANPAVLFPPDLLGG